MKRCYSVEFTLFAIFSRQIIIWSAKIYEQKKVGSAAKYFVSLVSLNRISSHILFWTSQFFSLSINIFSISTFRQIFSLCNASSWVCQLVVPVLLLRTASIPSHQYFQDSKFMTCFTFSEYFAIMFFFLYFISFPKGLTKPVPEE